MRRLALGSYRKETPITEYAIKIPDSKFARAVTEIVRDTASELLFNHSSRVYQFAALAGEHRGLKFDRELVYIGAMFHDMGLTETHNSPDERFEVDGANAARDFMTQHGLNQADIDKVWLAIALHDTPGIPQHMDPVIALVTAGVEMDVLGIGYANYSDAEREAIVRAFPRTANQKEDILQAFYDGLKHKPHTTFGNVLADVIVDKAPHCHPGNFCAIVRSSHWHA